MQESRYSRLRNKPGGHIRLVITHELAYKSVCIIYIYIYLP